MGLLDGFLVGPYLLGMLVGIREGLAVGERVVKRTGFNDGA